MSITQTLFLVLASIFPFKNDSVAKLLINTQSQSAEKKAETILKLGKRLPDLDSTARSAAAIKLIDASGDRTELVRSSAKLRIAQHGKLISPFLKDYVESNSFEKFAIAAEAIKAIGADAKKWMPELIKKLESEDRKFKMAALHAMGALDGDVLLPILDQAIEQLDSKDFNIQLSACRVISKMGPDAAKAGKRLVLLQEKGIASARSWASIALGAIGKSEDYDVAKLLEERLDYFYLIDRQRALEGLANLGPDAKSALPKIEKLMRWRAKSVEHYAAKAYWKITGDHKTAVEILIALLPTMEFGPEAMDILGEMKDQAAMAVPALIDQLKNSELSHREAAAYALAAIGTPAQKATKQLNKLRKKDEDILMRAIAELAINKINASDSAEVKKRNDKISEVGKAAK